MRRVVTVTLLATAIGATPVAASRVETVTIPGGSVRIEVPDRWVRVATDDLDTLSLIAAESSGGAVAEVFQAAFRPRARPLSAGPPVLLIHADEAGRLPWGRIALLPRLDDAARASDRWFTASGVPFAGDTVIEQLSFDRASFALRLQARVASTPWGEIAVDSTLFLTETGSVAVHGLAPIRQRELYNGLWSALLATVVFDDGLAYRPRVRDAWPWLIRQPSTWFVLAGLAAVATAYVAWRDRRTGAV